jgi:hypothetical protein
VALADGVDPERRHPRGRRAPAPLSAATFYIQSNDPAGVRQEVPAEIRRIASR